METSSRLPEIQFAMIPRTISPIQLPRRSLDHLNDHGSDSMVGRDSDGRMMSTELRTRVASGTGNQLPVKHVTESGTQRGTLLAKYLAQPASKCIMCRDCSIFFSRDAFLAHGHDRHGRKRGWSPASAAAAALELDLDSPDPGQARAWDECLAKIGANPDAVRRKVDTGSSASISSLPTESVSVLLNPETAGNRGREGAGESGRQERAALSLSDFDRNVRESVDASERLLRETSQYLHSSAEKLRHRRQRSLQGRQFHPRPLQADSLPSDGNPGLLSGPLSLSTSGRVQPVIRTATTAAGGGTSTTRPNRRFLEKYLEKSRDSFRLLSDSMSKSTGTDAAATAKGDAPKLELALNGGLPDQSIPLPSMGGGGGIARGSVREEVFGGGGDAERVSKRPVSPGKTPHGQSTLLQEHFDRNDPLFIVQTAQELLALATLKMQDNSHQSTVGIDWQARYEVERELSRGKDRRIKELEGLLQEEQRKRQEAEVQLRAIRLQNS